MQLSKLFLCLSFVSGMAHASFVGDGTLLNALPHGEVYTNHLQSGTWFFPGVCNLVIVYYGFDAN